MIFFLKDLMGMCYIFILRYITLFLSSFYVSHCGRWHGEVPHRGFNLHVPVENLCWAPFHMPIGHLNIFFCEMSVQVFCPVFKTARLFSYWFVTVLYISWICVLCQMCALWIFSPSRWLACLLYYCILISMSFYWGEVQFIDFFFLWLVSAFGYV